MARKWYQKKSNFRCFDLIKWQKGKSKFSSKKVLALYLCVFGLFLQEVSDDSDDVEIIKKIPVAQKPKQEDLDLTGSPLKASFTLEDDDDHDDFEAITVVKRVKGPSFHPIDTITARYV